MRKTLFAVFTAIALSCTITPAFAGGQLTNDMAKNVIWKFIYSYYGCASLKIIGVLEVQQNVARVDFQVGNMSLMTRDNKGTLPYNGPGAAAFIHYNDGSWHLKELSVGASSSTYTWKELDIVAK